MRWDESQLTAYQAKRGVDAFQAPAKPSKYRSKKVIADGETFDSKREYQRYCQLKMMEKAGKISGLSRQVKYELAPAVKLNGKTKRPLVYILDFQYCDREKGRIIFEDCKGCITDVFRIKQHLMMHVHAIDILLT